MPATSATRKSRAAKATGVVYVASIDLVSSPMERPYAKTFVTAGSPEQAREIAVRQMDAATETVRCVEELQPILDGVTAGIAQGKEYSITWKHEGQYGPVSITDLDLFPGAVGEPIGVPYGSAPKWEITMPWMTKAEAIRLAKHLGLTLGEA